MAFIPHVAAGGGCVRLADDGAWSSLSAGTITPFCAPYLHSPSVTSQSGAADKPLNTNQTHTLPAHDLTGCHQAHQQAQQQQQSHS